MLVSSPRSSAIRPGTGTEPVDNALDSAPDALDIGVSPGVELLLESGSAATDPGVITTLGVGVVFGFALAAPPGPMNALIATESVLRGWASGFRAGLGAMVADGVMFLLALVGVVTVIDRAEWARPIFYLAGGVLMLYFAADAIGDLRRGSSFGSSVSPVDATGFRKTFVLSLTNPYQLGFWMTVGVGLLRPGTIDVFAHLPHAVVGGSSLVVATGSPALLVGLFAGIAVWVVVYPAALVAAERRVNALAPLIAVLGGGVLAVFGIGFLLLGVAGVVGAF